MFGKERGGWNVVSGEGSGGFKIKDWLWLHRGHGGVFA